MKLVAGTGKAFGGLVLLVAVMAFITAASLFVVGGYLTMWPVLRLSPRGQRKQAVLNFAVSCMTLAQVFAPNADDDEDDDSDEQSS